MGKMVIGLFDGESDAQATYDELVAAGFDKSELDMVGNRAEGKLKLDMLPNHIPEPDVNFFMEGVRQGGTLIIARTDNRSSEEAAAIMQRHNMVDVDTRMSQYQQKNANAKLRDYDENQGDVVLPVIEEQLQVGKRQVQGSRMRVYTRLTETPVTEQVTLREETVHVERRPVDRALNQADTANAFKEQLIEITESSEEAVVAKTARVIEEVVVGKQTTEHTETIRDTVRRTDVDVEQIEGETRSSGTTTAKDYRAFDKDFRSYYEQHGGKRGYTYEQYSPIFRYGYDLASDSRYQGDWSTVEADARRGWEEKNPGTWEQVKDSVRYSWDKVRGKR